MGKNIAPSLYLLNCFYRSVIFFNALVFMRKMIAKTVWQNHYKYCKLYTISQNSKPIWRVFLWEQTILVRWIHKWIVTQLHKQKTLHRPKNCISSAQIQTLCLRPGEGPKCSQQNHAGHGTGIAAAAQLIATCVHKHFSGCWRNHHTTLDTAFTEDLIITRWLHNYFYVLFFFSWPQKYRHV